MKNIMIIVPEEGILGSIEGPRQLFTEVNQFMMSMDKPPLFDVKLVGLNKTVPVNKGMCVINVDHSLEEAGESDLIIIPALQGDLSVAIKNNEAFVPWIVKQYKNGSEVASLCLGAFLLASTGLVNDRKCATHWMAANDFRRMFPDVDLVADRILTDEKGIYSSGGAFSYLNLILYLIEKYAGREIAVLSSKVFQIDIDRGSQSPFIMFKGQKDHEDDAIRKAQEYIEKNFAEKITVDQIATRFAIGRRNLERRFKKATSNTVVEYIQRVKIEAAKMSLESSRENVNEVMYNVGYADPKAFRMAFKRITGLSPINYRNKYNREVEGFRV